MENLLVLFPSLMLGIALSASSGFRIFIPLLISNLSVKFGLIDISDNFLWMASDTATIILVVASIVEVGAYYIPFIDNLLDTIAVPSSVVAGTLLTSQFLEINDPTLQWGLGLIAGGGVAGTVQLGTSFLRLGSSKLTGGIGNPFFSTLENIVSTLTSILAIWLPVFIGLMALIFTFWLLKRSAFRKK